MTKESLFFDTDCLSAFLWVKEESLLVKLYPGRVVIPQQVYEELSNPKVSHLKNRVESLLKQKLVRIQSIDISSEEFELYRKMTYIKQPGYKLIGNGEAASIVLSKYNNGIVASNNFKDIKQYIEEFNLEYTTTADILVDAFNKKLATKDEIENIWSLMLAKRRKLGASSFDEYLKNIKKN